MNSENKNYEAVEDENKQLSSKHLDLSKSGLTKFPISLVEDYPFVKCLYLTENLLSELPGEIFLKLRHLSWLDVRHNFLLYLPKSLANHPSLEIILLQGNQIQELPVELGLVPNLRGLQLSDNPLVFPPKDILEKGIQSILNFLRNECKVCSKYSPEVIKKTHHQENVQHMDKSLNEDKEDHLKMGITCRRNTTPYSQERIHYNLSRRRATVDDYSITAKNVYENEDNLLKPSQQIVPMCKSAIRVMTNPKIFTPVARNSAPNLNRHKSERVVHKNLRNAATSRSKQAMMKQDAIIQKRKNEEALKSWRDKMRAMNNKGIKPKNDATERQKSFPYGTDPEFYKMPTRDLLQASSSSSKAKQVVKSMEKVDISSEIDNELSVIFRTLQDLKNLKENSPSSPRSEQKSASEKLLKITELQAAIGDLKKRNSKQRIVKMAQK